MKAIPLHEIRKKQGNLDGVTKLLFQQRLNSDFIEVDFVKDNFKKAKFDLDGLESYRISTVTILHNGTPRNVPFTMLFICQSN